MIERYLKDTAATPSVTFYEDGAAVDPGTVTVTVTREDGTALATGASTSGSGAAARTYSLTAASHTGSLDFLRLDWESATKGTLTTYVEIVGGFLFTLATARTIEPLDDPSTYSTAELITARTLAETALEEACGVAFVPRYARERLDGNGDVDLLLKPRPLTIASASVDGTALTAGELADLELYDDGRLYNPLSWTAGRRNVEVKYTHGYAWVPPRVGRACLLLTKRFLVDTPISDRATSVSSPETGMVQYLVTAGVRDAVFDIPECNAVVSQYGMSYGVG